MKWDRYEEASERRAVDREAAEWLREREKLDKQKQFYSMIENIKRQKGGSK